MAEATIVKLHKHFSRLAEGNFTERDFDSDLGGADDGGTSVMGKMSPERRALIISDAKENLKRLETKTFPDTKANKEAGIVGQLCYPFLTEGKKEEPKREVKLDFVEEEPKKEKVKKSK